MRRFFQKWKGSFKNRNTIRGSFENEQVLSKAIVFPSTVGGSFENNRVLSKIEGFLRNTRATGGPAEGGRSAEGGRPAEGGRAAEGKAAMPRG